MKKYLSAAMLMMSLSAGYGQKTVNAKLPVIDVAANLGTYRKVPISELISGMEYIPLETGQKFLIDQAENIIVTGDRIFVAGQNFCYAFTRDGKFISDVGRIGRGPGEWWGVLEHISVDEKNRKIYIDVYDKILEYTWDGKFIRDIPTPKLGKGELTSKAMNISFLRDNLFLGWISSIARSGPPYWIIFDDKGTTVKTIDNHEESASKNVKWKNSRAMFPSVMSGQAYLKENINDTLYRLNTRDELVPAFVFDLGKYSPVKSGAASLSDMGSEHPYIEAPPLLHPMNRYPSNLFFVSNRILFPVYLNNIQRLGIKVPKGNTETVHFGGNPMVPDFHEIDIDYTAIVLGLYNISTGKAELFDRDPVSCRMGFVNDIDGGPSFWPRYQTSSGELVDVWEAFEMKDILTEEYFSAHPAKDPAAHAKLRTLLKNLDETDNPVIVVAKLK